MNKIKNTSLTISGWQNMVFSAFITNKTVLKRISMNGRKVSSYMCKTFDIFMVRVFRLWSGLRSVAM
jgi:hypothetical protein